MLRTCLVTLCLLCAAEIGQSADTLVIYDGTAQRGRVLRLNEGLLEFRPEGEQQPAKIPLGNLSSVKLVPAPPDPQKSGIIRLIDNDGPHPATERSGKIKLRKGLHAFTMLYFNGDAGGMLDLQWEGPGIQKQKVPRNLLRRWKNNARDITYSDGLDEEGFRLPDTIDQTLPQITYKLYEWSPEQASVDEVGDLRNLTLKKYGAARQIGINFPHQTTHFGAVIYWLLNVPRDGEYTFHLNSDDGSQLYVGKVPPIAHPSIRKPGANKWLFRLRDNAQLNQPLRGWDKRGVRCRFESGGQEQEIVIPREHLRELWRRKYADQPDQVDRSGEPDDADTVYAQNPQGQIQRVTGEVLGIAGDTLRFDYQGTERKIPLQRVAGVVMRQPGEVPSPPDRRVQLRFDLCGPDELIGHLVTLEGGRAALELPWGQELKLNRNLIYRMTILNGRMQSLQELTPDEVVQTPFLDHIPDWQTGKSLTGGSLQIGETSYPKGLCLHSRTKLRWELSGEYERFQCDLGLQQGDGDSGNALVRITADGAELFAADEVTATPDPMAVDVDLSGRRQLTLEVDFGRNMHIGDHVVFGNARLLRPELAP